MGNRSKALRAGGAFGTKQFVEHSRKVVTPFEKLIPPDLKTGAPAKTEIHYKTTTEKRLVGVKRPTRAFGRQQDRITRLRGKRIITTRPASSSSSQHSKDVGPMSFMKKLFQRKSGG